MAAWLRDPADGAPLASGAALVCDNVEPMVLRIGRMLPLVCPGCWRAADDADEGRGGGTLMEKQ